MLEGEAASMALTAGGGECRRRGNDDGKGSGVQQTKRRMW